MLGSPKQSLCMDLKILVWDPQKQLFDYKTMWTYVIYKFGKCLGVQRSFFLDLAKPYFTLDKAKPRTGDGLVSGFRSSPRFTTNGRKNHYRNGGEFKW